MGTCPGAAGHLCGVPLGAVRTGPATVLTKCGPWTELCVVLYTCVSYLIPHNRPVVRAVHLLILCDSTLRGKMLVKNEIMEGLHLV